MRSESQWVEVSRCPQCGMPRYEMEEEYLDQCCCKGRVGSPPLDKPERPSKEGQKGNHAIRRTVGGCRLVRLVQDAPLRQGR